MIEGHHEALISQRIFDKVNAGVETVDTTKKETKKRKRIFFCGHCGKALQLRSRTSSRYHYRSRTQERVLVVLLVLVYNDIKCQKEKFSVLFSNYYNIILKGE